MNTEIRLQVVGGQWMATWVGPGAAEIVAAMGTATLPTAFVARASAETVRAEIARLNPGCVVRVMGDVWGLRAPGGPVKAVSVGTALRRAGVLPD